MKKHHRILDDPAEFFVRDHRNTMRLTGDAAAAICEAAADKGFQVLGVEGGLWLDPGFESRLDSLWSAENEDGSFGELRQSNAAAADFIRDQMESQPRGGLSPPNVFILTTRRTS